MFQKDKGSKDKHYTHLQKKGIQPSTYAMSTRNKQTAQCFSEYYEFVESEIQCKNEHSLKASSTLGAFVYSYLHGIVLG